MMTFFKIQILYFLHLKRVFMGMVQNWDWFRFTDFVLWLNVAFSIKLKLWS